MARQVITVGHDAELFLYDKNNEAIPSVGLVGGSKACPREVNGGAVQEDNVMAEINIEPSTTATLFVNRTNEVLDSLSTITSRHGLHWEIMDYQKFNPEFLKSKQAKEFGCMPDYNIYSLQENIIDTSTLNKDNVRTAGGHIHVGLTNPDFHPMARSSLVKGCDFYIGLPLTLLEHKSKRKAFYGQAGSFRQKEYGIEYRTPSNIWLSTDNTKGWVFQQIKRMANDVICSLATNDQPIHERRIIDIGEDVFQEIINCGLSDDAYELCQNYGIEIPFAPQ